MRARARRQVAAGRIRRRRPEEGDSDHHSSDHSERRPDLLGGQPACWSSARSTTTFVGEVGEAFANVRVGTPAMNLDLGPMISAVQRDRVNGFVEPRASIRHSRARRRAARQRSAERRFLRDADPVRSGSARRYACLRRSLWSRAFCDAVRGRGGRHRACQRDRLWPRRGGLDPRRRTPDAASPRASAAARCSSTAMAPAAASSCRSAA